MQYAFNDGGRRGTELLQALFASVVAGNMDAAQADLRMIASAHGGDIGDLASRAMFDRHRPYQTPDLTVPFVLPMPGHTPGMMLSGHTFKSTHR